MFRLLIIITTLILAGCSSTSSQYSKTTSHSNNNELVTWIDHQLIPYMSKTLSTHPKFSGAPILMVGLEGGQINNQINNLTRDIREHISNRLVGYPNIHIVRRQIDYQKNHHRSMTNASCDNDINAQYIIGLDLKQSSITDGYTLQIKAASTDNPDHWVTGFSQTWHGNLTAKQHRAAKIIAPDSYLKGLRELPFAADEKDLLAQYMAHNLSCVLTQSGHASAKIFIDNNQLTAEYRDILKMTGNMLSRFNDIKLTLNSTEADAELEFDIIKLNNQSNLKQFNVEVVYPNGQRAGGTASQVYIQFEPQVVRANINQWQFVIPNNINNCHKDNPWQSGEFYSKAHRLTTASCFALEYDTTGSHNYIVYLSPDGFYAKVSNQCLTSSINQNKTRLPAKVGEFNAIYLEKYKGAEQFYLISASKPLPQSKLKTWLDQLPDFCDEDKVKPTNALSLSHMLATAAKKLPSLDWRVITLNHI